MQFIEAPVDEFNVKLSFGINDVCKIFPKNIIIVAGTKSSGKTALLMKWALDNQDRYPVVYLNSEMGDEEYSERLKSFGIKQASDIKMSSYNCHKNFHDFISDEQKIFIIDFMEVHDDFAQIASYIRKVHEKLRQGICIIAVQKKVGAAFGRGAEFSMEKSRLYINLDFLQDESCTKLTLTDVKTPRYNLGYDHPRGKYKRIKILGGSKMTSLDADWRS
jgi:KaiC/GvpD/RAD55 family RecA-like ATPase